MILSNVLLHANTDTSTGIVKLSSILLWAWRLNRNLHCILWPLLHLSACFSLKIDQFLDWLIRLEEIITVKKRRKKADSVKKMGYDQVLGKFSFWQRKKTVLKSLPYVFYMISHRRSTIFALKLYKSVGSKYDIRQL